MTIERAKHNPAFLSDEKLIESFVVRGDALQSILQVIRENTGRANQHILVTGARGMGKTMLMRRTAAEINRDAELSRLWHPVVFAEESYGVLGAGEFWLEALARIADEPGNERWKRTFEDLRTEKDDSRLRERALSQLSAFTAEQNRRLLLIVENMGMLFESQIGDKESWNIRHTLMNEPRIMLIGTAVLGFDAPEGFKEAENPGKAMFELFRNYELKPLNRDECCVLWEYVTHGRPSAGRIRAIQILTGGNPRLLTITAAFGKTLSFKGFMRDLMELIDDNTEYFKSRMDGLTPPERKIYASLLELWRPATARETANAARMDVNETSAVLARLAGKGAVAANAGRGRSKVYQSAERMFNIYWLMRSRAEAAVRVKAVVDFMTHFYSESELCGVAHSIAAEAGSAASETRGLHYCAYRGIVGAVSEPRRAEYIMETPTEFFTATDAPAGMKKEALVACFNQGNDWSNKKEFEKAVESYNKALSINPEDAKAWNNKGVTLGKLGRTEEEITCYDKAISINPEDAKAWFNKGVTLGILGRTEEEITCYDKAISINPGDADAWNNKGVALNKSGKNEALFEHLKSYYSDNELVKATMNTAIKLAVGSAAAGFTQKLIDIIGESPAAQSLEPLLAGLRIYNGEEVNVPAEVRETAQDVVERIKKLNAPDKEKP